MPTELFDMKFCDSGLPPLEYKPNGLPNFIALNNCKEHFLCPLCHSCGIHRFIINL